MNAAELKERIWRKSLVDITYALGKGIEYYFLNSVYDDPRKRGRLCSDFVCSLPNKEVDRMFEEFKQKYAQQQIEQEL